LGQPLKLRTKRTLKDWGVKTKALWERGGKEIKKKKLRPAGQKLARESLREDPFKKGPNFKIGKGIGAI